MPPFSQTGSRFLRYPRLPRLHRLARITSHASNGDGAVCVLQELELLIQRVDVQCGREDGDAREDVAVPFDVLCERVQDDVGVHGRGKKREWREEDRFNDDR